MGREKAAQKGLPRPWTSRPYGKHGRLPIPYTANYNVRKNTGLATVNNRRANDCYYMKKCLVCGEKLPRRFWVIYDSERGFILEGGMHPKCCKITVSFCPHITDGVLAKYMFVYSFTRREGQGPLTLVEKNGLKVPARKRHLFTPKVK